MRLVLGSESPFRAAVLRQAGYKFEVFPANIDEKAIRDNDPAQLVLKLGIAKSDAVAKNFITQQDRNVIIITSDQVLVRINFGSEVEGILEKPLNQKDQPDLELAREYLESYQFYGVRAYTSLVVYNLLTGHQTKSYTTADLYLSKFNEDEIGVVLNDPNTYKAAGGLCTGIKGSPASEIIERHIFKFIGEKASFIGLPIKLLKQALSAMNFRKPFKA